MTRRPRSLPALAAPGALLTCGIALLVAGRPPGIAYGLVLLALALAVRRAA